MKWSTLAPLVLAALAPNATLAGDSGRAALRACAAAIAEHRPAVEGPKQVVNRRSGPRSRYAFWIDAGSDEDGSSRGIYCLASHREGVLSLVVQPDHWTAGRYPRPEAADTALVQNAGG